MPQVLGERRLAVLVGGLLSILVIVVAICVGEGSGSARDPQDQSFQSVRLLLDADWMKGVRLPESVIAGEPPGADESIRVVVNSRGDIEIDGQSCGGSRRSVEGALQKSASALLVPPAVVIAMDSGADWGAVDDVLSACQAARPRLFRVHFLVRHRATGRIGQVACFGWDGVHSVNYPVPVVRVNVGTGIPITDVAALASAIGSRLTHKEHERVVVSIDRSAKAAELIVALTAATACRVGEFVVIPSRGDSAATGSLGSRGESPLGDRPEPLVEGVVINPGYSARVGAAANTLEGRFVGFDTPPPFNFFDSE